MNDSKDIQIKKAFNSRIDVENQICFKVKGVSFELSIKMNPGTDYSEE